MAENCEDRLKNLEAEYEEFAYIVSHDLKAPARAISNLAGWMEEDLEDFLTPDTRKNFLLLKNRTERLTNMIQALLEYSRVKRMHLDINDFNIKAKVEEIATEFKKNKSFRLELKGNIPDFKTYSEKLSFVIRELLTNALRFNDKPVPEITIYLKAEENFAAVEISDNGPGMPENAFDKIFTIFYTVKPKDQNDTTGAGLAIVNKIVNFVGGKIEVKNRPEGGAIFTVKWPLNLPEKQT